MNDMDDGRADDDQFQEVSIYVDGSYSEALGIQQALARSHPSVQVRFGQSMPPVNHPLDQQMPVIQVADAQSLHAVSERLAEMHKTAWVTIVDHGTPHVMSLQDWMRQKGLP
jgi:hypothetical protein